jgi:hypothetical protein
LLDELKLKAQAFNFFKAIMLAKSIATMKPPLDCNPCSRMWALLTTNQIVYSKLLKWLKLVELSMAMVFSNVEGERCFFNMSFMKSIEKQVDNPFGSNGANVYTVSTLWKVFHLLQLLDLGTNKRIERL